MAMAMTQECSKKSCHWPAQPDEAAFGGWARGTAVLAAASMQRRAPFISALGQHASLH
jgi:hypothetical protein